MGLTVGIDASRNRSGGARAHLIGIVRDGRPLDYGVSQVHVWSYQNLLNALPERKWLRTHAPKAMEHSLPWQMLWQRYVLPRQARALGCDIVLNTDAGSVLRFRPAVTMSRDALSYEPGEMQRYRFSKRWLRLLLLRYLQNDSLRSADGCIFLTQYISDLIQQYTGSLSRVKIVPHGIDPLFRKSSQPMSWPSDERDPIQLIYVSNVELYKHQWHVIEAVSTLLYQGHNLKLVLAGGTDGWKAQGLLDDAIKAHDPESNWIEILGHVPPNQLPDLLAQSHIFVFASSCETIAITLLEGMASGLPIASSNRGPLPEVLQQGAVYFDPEDAVSIAATVERLITDSEKRREVSRQALERSKLFSWERCASQTFAFLSEVAHGNKATT